MAKLHAIERAAGRRRKKRWGPRCLDLDLLDYHGLRRSGARNTLKPLRLTHPGIADRKFVVSMLLEGAPKWHSPLTHITARHMLKKLR